MSDETTTEVTEESGSALRSKLEEALTANRELADANKSLAAQVVIQSNGFNYVKPEDLAGVSVDEYAAKAAEIQAAKATEREQIFREMAAARGITIDEAVASSAPAQDPAIARVASLGNLGGVAPGQVKPTPQSAEDWFDVALKPKK